MDYKQTVLVVDDIADNLNVAANTLLIKDINVLLAQSGKEAIKTTEKYLPDLILLDIMMPEMDGFEVCEILKNNENTKQIPIIFLTGIDDVSKIIEGFTLGAVDYITKPFNTEVVLARVETHLTIAQMQKEKDIANLILEQKVASRTAEIQSINDELKKEIEERKLIEIQLKENNKQLKLAKKKAEDSDKLKTEFLNTISHEVRTPLNGIVGFVNLLKTPGLSEDDRTTFMNEIVTGSDQLIEIFSDVMLFSSLEANQVKEERKEFKVKDLLDNISGKFATKATSKKLNFGVSNNTKYETLTLDANKIEQILYKLVDNAIKYTKKGNISLSVEENSEKINFVVSDTGIGIPEKFQEQIFARFTQADGKLTREYGGTGLGLAIVKSLTELMGGTINLESQENKGSRFKISIPL